MKLFNLKKISIIKLFIFEFFLFVINRCSTIKFKINSFKFLGEDNKSIYIKNENDQKIYFYYDLILNNIYTSILIGEPPKKILGFYSGKINEFDIIHKKCFIFNSLYDRIKSKTFHNISSFNISHKDYKNGCFAKENFQFEQYSNEDDNKINLKKIALNQLKFFLPDDYNQNSNKINNINTCSIIGLKLNNKDIFKETPKNFIYYLMQYYSNKKEKNNNLNSFYWTIKYDNENDNIGYFSIGDPPHIYEPNNYKFKSFKEINIEYGYSSLSWDIKFKEIYLNKSLYNSSNNNELNHNLIYLKKYNDGHKCIFYPEINIFLGTIEYFNTIKKEFFKKFFLKNICFEKKVYISEINSTIIDGLGGLYNIIYCDKNKIEKYGITKFYSEFPSINFYHKLINYTFIFSGKELFYEEKKENKLYFLISIKNNAVDQWIFGKIFMKKYQVIFNSEMKTIGFYININNYNNQYNNLLIYTNKKVIVLILIIMVILLLLIIGNLLYKYRKKFFYNKKIIVKELEMTNRNDALI